MDIKTSCISDNCYQDNKDNCYQDNKDNLYT